VRHRSALILLSLGGLAASGCLTTYELSPVPPGHPASPSAPEAPVERSATLAEAEPVDPRPARSEQWARPSEGPTPHDHDNDHEHEHRHPGRSEMEHDALEHDRHHEHRAPPAPEGLAAHSFDGQLAGVLHAYFEAAEALASDDPETAGEAMEGLQTALDGVDPQLLDAARREAWLEIAQRLDRPMQRFIDAPGIEAARTAFGTISEQMVEAVRELGSEALGPVHLLHCPMAFGGRGAHWLQPTEEVANPYYGAAMLRCGSVEETLVQGSAIEPGDEDGGEERHHDGHEHDHGHHPHHHDAHDSR
jgi:hypothetical protein